MANIRRRVTFNVVVVSAFLMGRVCRCTRSRLPDANHHFNFVSSYRRQQDEFLNSSLLANGVACPGARRYANSPVRNRSFGNTSVLKPHVHMSLARYLPHHIRCSPMQTRLLHQGMADQHFVGPIHLYCSQQAAELRLNDSIRALTPS